MSYIVGHGKVAILDPGPDDDTHIAALLDAVRGETVTHIFVTHTHRDHSPAVPKVKAATGAKVYAEGPHRLARPLFIGETRRLDASADMNFAPDVTLADGEVVSGDGWTLRGGDDARPHRQPHGLRVQGTRSAVLRRSRDGVVDLDRGAAGRRHERLHGLAAETLTPHRAALSARPWRAGARRAGLRARLHRAPARARSLHPASARQGRSRYPGHREGGLYRARSPPHRRRRAVDAGASGRSGRPRHRRNRRAAIDRRQSIASPNVPRPCS